MAKAIMVQGTGSDVGKSILVCALCRIFRQNGMNVAPFKAQNMSNNSYVTADGREMGRAQAAQAEAAGILPEAEMNPVLLKPSGNNGSQIITMGRPLRHMTAHEYYENKELMLDIAKKAYESLSDKNDIIVIEGAGSPVEINIKDNDIVNMKIAEIADAPVILVADIERGGTFAWIVGTLELLNSNERERVVGIIINKFRGDMAILESGIKMLEERIKKPVLGVLPYFTDIDIDDEDSVSLDKRNKGQESSNLKISEAQIDIVVIRLPRISNFTDFDIFKREKDIRVRFIDKAQSIGNPDLIILPGTKNTISDLKFIKDNGIADAIIELEKKGTMVIGICGGYQMLGKVIRDPENAESKTSETGGLGLIDVSTLFKLQKNTYQVKARLYDNGPYILKNLNTEKELKGYEIHMGETELLNGTSPFLKIIERSDKEVCMNDGAVSNDGNIIGTYLHGIFDNVEFRFQLINHLRTNKDLSPISPEELSTDDKEKQYDKLADLVRKHIDMDLIYKIIKYYG
ncbi:cobyric acid synthase CobQ [Candidatus Scalindua japonica]|uniref:Cobyric acid synthase n=1 Tax=Candidatus Scalindua japonica TaxID=1284222 RepID=A0A286TUJ1_9BACT|nr:cobyric acid synthase [Candidatus Scalindua japonica]GAX59548.1 cobyric acid synthase CobQ [Candidatus Scalindua japonica]